MADTSFFSWATDTLDVDDVATKLQPASDIQSTGFVRGEPIARVWLNYMFNRIFGLIEPQVNDIVTVSSALGTTAIAARYGGVAGNWTYQGNTGALTGGAAGTIYFYKRTT